MTARTPVRPAKGPVGSAECAPVGRVAKLASGIPGIIRAGECCHAQSEILGKAAAEIAAEATVVAQRRYGKLVTAFVTGKATRAGDPQRYGRLAGRSPGCSGSIWRSP